MAGEHGPYVKKLVYASLFAALTAAGAWIAIPLPYVPLTLQTLFTMLSGAVLGPYYGALSMLVYILTGLVGLPVFSRGQSGPGVLLGSTGGYLAGFIVCAIVTGLLVKSRKNPGYIWFCLSMAAGTIALYACGMAWLLLLTGMPVDRAVIVGVLPFVPGDLIKILAGAAIARKLKV